MTKERAEKPHTCGNCRWYDALGDLCRNGKSPHDWDFMDRRDTCRKWEKNT